MRICWRWEPYIWLTMWLLQTKTPSLIAYPRLDGLFQIVIIFTRFCLSYGQTQFSGENCALNKTSIFSNYLTKYLYLALNCCSVHATMVNLALCNQGSLLFLFGNCALRVLQPLYSNASIYIVAFPLMTSTQDIYNIALNTDKILTVLSAPASLFLSISNNMAKIRQRCVCKLNF